MRDFFRLLFMGGLSLSALCLLASIILFIMGFVQKDNQKALQLFKRGAMLFFGFLLLFMVGFGMCVESFSHIGT